MTLRQAIISAERIWVFHCDIILRINKKQAHHLRQNYGPWIDDDNGEVLYSSWTVNERGLFMHIPQS